MIRSIFRITVFLLLTLGSVLDTPVVANPLQPPTPAALVNASRGFVEWTPQVDAESIVLALADPQGLVRTIHFGAGEAPVLSLFDTQDAPLPDGTYTWELRVTPRLGARLVQSGHFTIHNGDLVSPDLSEQPESPSRRGNSPAPRTITAPDQVVPDDLIVDGKGCIGLSCVNSEAFGAEALRLKQSVVRLRFEDTSATGFPARDWQLTVNDSASGGADRFSIEDLTAGTTPLTVRGGAPNNSLYVDPVGKVGLGTSTPADRLHVLENTDAGTVIRAENTNSGLNAQGSFRAQSNAAVVHLRAHGSGRTVSRFGVVLGGWSEIVQDIGNGLVIGTQTDKPIILGTNNTNRLHITPTGDVGIGTSSPGRSLDVARSGAVDVGFYNSSATHAGGGAATPARWFFQVDNDPNRTFKISREGGGGPVLTVDKKQDANGPTFKVDGSVQATNVVYTSSRSSKEDFKALEPQDVLARVAKLPISEWSFKEGPEQVRHIGPMAEDFHDAFGLSPDAGTISVTDTSGVALAAIQGLLQRIEELEKRNTELAEQLHSLKNALPQNVP